MSTCYVDCDGTLVFGEKINYSLVDAIKQFLDDHSSFDLVVWSHSGVQHARNVASRCFDGTGYPTTVLPKDFTAVNLDEDLVVDNMNLPFGLKPGQFVKDVRNDTLTLPEADDGGPGDIGAWRPSYDMGRFNERMGAR